MIRMLLILLVLTATRLNAEEIVLGLSQDEVSITATFDGSDILIFGAVKRDAPIPKTAPLDVIVSISGPRQDIKIRRKGQVGPIWVNTESRTLHNVPSFYALASNRPLEDILPRRVDEIFDISAQAALLGEQEFPQEFADALLRLRAQNGMLVEIPNAVSMNEETLFRVRVALPADLIEGYYRARIFLLRDGDIIDTTSTGIPVRKVGMERFLFRMSRHHPVQYGILALVIAALAGWGASRAFELLRR